MSSRTSSSRLAVFLIAYSSSFNVKRNASDSTSLHTSDKSVAVISLTLLCRNIPNPPFLHDISFWTLKPSPHEQLTRKSGIGQSYRNLMKSQNCSLFNTYLNSGIGITFVFSLSIWKSLYYVIAFSHNSLLSSLEFNSLMFATLQRFCNHNPPNFTGSESNAISACEHM